MKLGKLECINKCQFNRLIWEVGDVLDWTGKSVTPCPECSGGCRKCGHTGRLVPPYHFQPIGPQPSQEEVVKKVEDEKAMLKRTLKEAGKAYDNRWGVSKLRNEVKKLRGGKA